MKTFVEITGKENKMAETFLEKGNTMTAFIDKTEPEMYAIFCKHGLFSANNAEFEEQIDFLKGCGEKHIIEKYK